MPHLPLQLAALRGCRNVFQGWLHDADPHRDLEPGESADRDAAAGMLELVEAAITEAEKPAPPLPELYEVMHRPATSFWLKGCLRTALVRDPVDAAADADLLAALLRQRCNEALSHHEQTR